MKKIVFTIVILMLGFSGYAYADPNIVSDPSAGCETCFYEVDGDTTQYPTEADGSIMHDIETIEPGEHIFQFRYGRAWTADASEGDLPVDYGDWSLPFHLTRPGVLPTPTGQKLTK